jgi:hypothetical protein
MSRKFTGRATIVVDGKRLKADSGATLNVGGSNRTAVMGGGEVHGYREEDVVPSMECTVNHNKDLSLRELSDITGATVLFETDSGAQFVLREAWTTEPASLNSKDGTVSLKMEAIACDEV